MAPHAAEKAKPIGQWSVALSNDRTTIHLTSSIDETAQTAAVNNPPKRLPSTTTTAIFHHGFHDRPPSFLYQHSPHGCSG